MNVFDFDNTIYDGDSTFDFVRFCMMRHPSAMLSLTCIAYASIRYYLFRIGTKTEFKERMYSFLEHIDGEKDVERFWSTHLNKIKPLYREIHRPDDLIISASPEFLLKPLESLLEIRVIASVVSITDGKYNGPNCYHAEKVNRFRSAYPDEKIGRFYSDSYSDEPLALIAQEAFIVEKDSIVPWDFSKHKKRLRT